MTSSRTRQIKLFVQRRLIISPLCFEDSDDLVSELSLSLKPDGLLTADRSELHEQQCGEVPINARGLFSGAGGLALDQELFIWSSGQINQWGGRAKDLGNGIERWLYISRCRGHPRERLRNQLVTI